MSTHHAHQMYAHVTWHTWQRVGCVDAAAGDDLRSAVASASRATGVHVLRGAVLADHVHLVISFRPDSRLTDFVRLAKSVAATRANARVPGAVRWARGYFVTTIHRRDLSRVIQYVAHQFERHPDKIPSAARRPTDPGRKPGVHGRTDCPPNLPD
jgi:putative transposase